VLEDPPSNGPVWATATDDLNATILEWKAGRGTPAHVNHECDVVVVVLEGRGEVSIGGNCRKVATSDVIVIEKGQERRITAGPEGVRYLTVHRRRPGIAIRPRSIGVD
jgi:quercetin dioxygenase-like cupin family protein